MEGDPESLQEFFCSCMVIRLAILSNMILVSFRGLRRFRYSLFFEHSNAYLESCSASDEFMGPFSLMRALCDLLGDGQHDVGVDM